MHTVLLTRASIKSNARYWDNRELVPKRAFTLGLGTLYQAEQTLLLVSSEAKAKILAATLEGPIGPEVPATRLRTMDNVIVIADREASGQLSSATQEKGQRIGFP